MAHSDRAYVPAAGHDWTLPLYDPVVKLLGGDAARRELIEQADPRPGHHVLEVGCGTGALLMLIRRERPGVDLVGLDPDPRALARARRKAQRVSASIRLDQGFADALPYTDASFDRVLACFMLHHLNDVEEKRRSLAEMRRVLRPAGRLHLLDFTVPDGGRAGLVGRWLHSPDRLKDNRRERVLALMADAGFGASRIVAEGRMMLVVRTAYFEATL
jgi:ubiquinone/menaquinone biosynthesis C-methylase UbiE